MITRISFIKIGALMVFYLVVIQDLIASIFFKIGLPFPLIRMFILLKEFIVIFCGMYFLLKMKRISKMGFILLLFILYSFLFLFVSDLSLFHSLLGYRTYILLFFAFIFGEGLGSGANAEQIMLKHFRIIFSFILVFSFLEYFILPKSIWLSVFPIIAMKKQVLGLTVDEYMNSGLPVNAFGEITNRMLGPFNDPLTLSYFALILFNFYLASLLFRVEKPNKMRVVIGTVLIFLTQTRAVIIGLFLSVMGVIFRSRRIRIIYIISGVLSLATVPVILFVFRDWFAAFAGSIFTKGGRNIGHLQAYADGINTLLDKPLGYGLGTSSIVGGFASKNLGTENAFINIGIEIGVAGLIWLLSIFIFLFFRFRNFLNTHPDSTPGYLVVAASYMLTVQYFFAGFVAPHIFIARILIPFAIMMGWAYAITRSTPSDINKG